MSLKLEDITINEEYEKLVPALPKEEYDQLKSSIRTNGLYLPIIINQKGIVLDGHHRHKICHELNIEGKYKVKKFDNKTDEIIFVGECNLQRRHLVPLQRIQLVEKLRPYYEKRSKQNKIDSGKIHGKGQEKVRPKLAKPMDVREELSKKANVSHGTYDKGLKILSSDNQKLIQDTLSGDKKIDSSFKLINMKEKNLKPQDLPTDKFDLIYIDPPWESVSGNVRGASESHYNTMGTDEISEMKLPMHDNCVVFLWTINSLMIETVELLKSWGLQYRSKIIWDKEIQGTGYWVRTQHEELWICTKGKVPVPDPGIVARSVYKEKRTSHSKKPEYFYGLIESYYPVRKKLEMFARNKRDGWNSWGNEV